MHAQTDEGRKSDTFMKLGQTGCVHMSADPCLMLVVESAVVFQWEGGEATAAVGNK